MWENENYKGKNKRIERYKEREGWEEERIWNKSLRKKWELPPLLVLIGGWEKKEDVSRR